MHRVGTHQRVLPISTLIIAFATMISSCAISQSVKRSADRNSEEIASERFAAANPVFLSGAVPLLASDDEKNTKPVGDSKREPDFEIGPIQVEFLTLEEAKEAITDHSDPFFDKLTPLEISLRLDRDVTSQSRDEMLKEFRAFLRDQVTEFSAEEKEILSLTLPRVAKACQKTCPQVIPTRWRFLCTNGRDELGAPYTRGNAIVLPQGTVQQLSAASLEKLGKLIIHESFHVWSRQNPTKRTAIYKEIGFEPIPTIALPDSIESIRLTNPDGPGWDHAITVKNPADGTDLRSILLLTSRIPQFSAGYKGVIPVLQFHLYALTNSDPPKVALDESGQPVRKIPFLAPGFMEKVGKNTGYLIHPDEICADNVAMLAYPPANIASPDILERLAPHLGGQFPAE